MPKSGRALLLAGLLVAGCGPRTAEPDPRPRVSVASAAEAEAFMAEAERELAALSVRAARASWVNNTYLTHDTEQLTAQASGEYSRAVQRNAIAAARFDGVDMSPELRRRLTLLKLSLAAPPPGDSAEAAELIRIGVGLRSDYGRGTYCRTSRATAGAAAGGVGTAVADRRPGDGAGPSAVDTIVAQECLQINDLSRILAESRDPAELLDVWQGWRTISPQMRDRFARFVELSNRGARELGFPDAGAMWRSGYDMDPDAFAREVDRLWDQVRPLYEALHAYTRARLVEHYGPSVVPPDGMIPAHLLGNMWAQGWANVSDIVAPAAAQRPYDLTELLRRRDVDAMEMARFGERFFSSLGFAPLPETFWQRSMFVKPRDREVVCHASAWNIDNVDDLRIKMCIDITAEDFVVVHHELGHNYYQRAYNHQPYLYQDGGNDGFHEAIGDAIALSITPEYLRQVGLLDTVPPVEADLGLLLEQALDKIAFLPFGLLVDQWRWRVFSGDVTPANYNASWWELRNRYQGVAAPVARSEQHFDPGAKFHVPANVPYTRYFLAHVLQFQFHRALCQKAGFTGPLHRCSIYGNREAGARLATLLEAGRSRPWPDILEEITGQREMDATAIVEYFAPLLAWLEEQNRGKPVGWGVNNNE